MSYDAEGFRMGTPVVVPNPDGSPTAPNRRAVDDLEPGDEFTPETIAELRAMQARAGVPLYVHRIGGETRWDATEESEE